MFTKTKKEEEELYKITREYLRKISETSKVKAGLNPENLLKSVCKIPKVIEHEEKVIKFITESTEECDGGKISTIDTLYNFNGWSEHTMNRNEFAVIIKDNYEVKSVKLNGRMIQCLINIKWKAGYEQLKEGVSPRNSY